jgi:uncharacterized protein (TIGR02611 family)
MTRAKNFLRKAAVLTAGVPLVIGGFILIPLPGPGLLFIVAGLFVLALEFEWAQRHLDTAKGHLKRVQETAKRKTAGKAKPDKQPSSDSSKRL